MIVRVKKRFLKQLAALPSDTRVRVEKFVFEELPSIRSLGESGRIEQMRGYRGCYKVRFGNFRLGLTFEDNIVIVRTVMDRKEIYRFFP